MKQDDQTHTDHFENIQSTNWQTVRFKPPPPNADIGWRVEFRSMEAQFHDFENAALVIFMALMMRVLTQFNINLYMRISAVDINMQRAQLRDAVLSEKFYWRKCAVASDSGHDDHGLVQITANEIINGGPSFIGLVPLIHSYLDTTQVSTADRAGLQPYLQFVSDRAAGRLMTGARWQREFVMNHPLYGHDSVVSNEIGFDLLRRVQKLTELDRQALLDAYSAPKQAK